MKRSVPPVGRSGSGRSPLISRRGLALLAVRLMSAGILATPVSAAAVPVFGSNLIVNGGAEAGPASPDGEEAVPVPGWTTSGPFTVVPYETDPDVVDPFPTVTGPGPDDRGTNFFAGGRTLGDSSASQLINVAAAAYLIDSGNVTYDLSGYLGGWLHQEDNAVLTVTFKQGAIVLGSAEIGPVTAGDRENATGLLYRDAAGFVPVGTRQILVTLVMTKDRSEGTYNDGYADNLSLVLTR